MNIRTLMLLPLCSLPLVGCGGSDSSSSSVQPAPVQDTTPPVISLLSDDELQIEVHTSFVEPGYSVSDDSDDDVAVVINGDVDTALLGTYTLTYVATDTAGNSAEVKRTVKVVDTTAPVITLLNQNALILEQGTEYREYGAEAADNYDADVEVTVSHNIDLATPGDYSVLYSATDSSNNTATMAKPVVVKPTTVTVSIDSFGDGVVELLNDTHTLTCSSSNICSVEVDAGTELSFSASASNEWQFLSWRGCETDQSENVCRLSAQSDVSLSLTFSPNESGINITLADNVVELNEQQKQAITDYNETTGVVMFDGNADLSAVGVGSILVSNGIDDGNGLEKFFLRRVVEILGQPGSLRVLKTEEATLDELIVEGAMVFQQALTAENVVQSSLPQGVKVLAPSNTQPNNGELANFSPIELAVSNLLLFDEDGDLKTTNDQVTAAGSIKLMVNPDFSLKIDFPATISHFRSVAHIDIESELGLDITGSVSADSLRKDFALPIKFAPIPLGVIVIQPEVQLSLVADASVQAEIKPRLVAKLDLVAGAQYTKARGFEGIKDRELSIDANDPFDAIQVKAEVKAGPEITYFTKLYGYVGPGVSNSLKLGVEAIPLPNNNVCAYDVNTFVELDVNFRGEFKIITKKFDYTATLFNFKKQISNLSRSCGSDTELTAPTGLITSDIGTEKIILDWNMVDSDADVSYKIYRNSVFLDSGIYESNYTDSNVALNTEYCYFVIAEDDMGNESLASTEVCGIAEEQDSESPTAPLELTSEALSSTAIQLAWSGATDNIGVEGYTIYSYTNDTYIAKQVSVDSMATILQLAPDTEYCYSVAAFDALGNTSEFSPLSCAKTNTKEESEWTMFIACEGRDYVVEEQFDLDQNLTSEVFVFGEAQDYDGTPMNYSLFGIYTDETGGFNGEINWSFAGSENLRKDEFLADLSTGDSGDVLMDQTKVTGCDAVIRFISSDNETPEAIPQLERVQSHTLGDTIGGLR